MYVPQSYDGSTSVPMIMELDCCVMDNTDALNAWNLDAIAPLFSGAFFLLVENGVERNGCWPIYAFSEKYLCRAFFLFC